MIRKKVVINCTNMKPIDRLTCDILSNARRPLTTNEVAEYANMSWLTAKKHLNKLSQMDIGIRSYKKGRAHLWLIEEKVDLRLKRSKNMVTIAEMYSLDWTQILHKAIQSRPTSWHSENPVAEYRNASDCIAQQVIQEMKKKGLIRGKT